MFLSLSSELAVSKPVTFTDITDEAGIQFQHIASMTEQRRLIEPMGSGAAFFDYDGDGDLDLYIVQSGLIGGMSDEASAGNVFYRNDGRLFTDVTEVTGTGDTGYGMGAATADYDNDGDEDLYVTNFRGDVLYRNNGDGTFTDVTKESGVKNELWGTSCVFVDIDRDGDLDLYVTNYVEYDLSMKPSVDNSTGLTKYTHPRYFNGTTDVMYRNNGDGTFTDITREAGMSNPVEGKGLGVAVGDYDNDGWPDIYVTNDTTRNFLYHNNQDGTFTDVGLFAGVGYNADGLPEGAMGVDFGDYNHDGWLDIFITNSSSETNTLYQNNGDGTFTDVTEEAGLGKSSYFLLSFGTKFFDYDNDGDLDLFIANGHLQDLIELVDDNMTYAQPDQLYQNNGNGRYTEISPSLGGYFAESYVGRGVAFGDYDNDGDTDVFVVNSNQRAVLLRNEGGNRNNWMQIQLFGTQSNRDGIGARVLVVCDGLRQIAEVQSGSSYASSNDKRLLFGIGKKKRINLIEIKWPSGITQTLENVKLNRLLKVKETK